MTESRDTGIKLFGKTIPPQEKGEPPLGFGKGDTGDKQKEASPRSKGKKEGTATPAEREEGDKNEPNISTFQNKSSKSEERRSEVTVDNSASNISQDNLLKKPDKILPCPRCSSLETKFCYYNNYSVNQPRHFCKNCQRYWTAGGTMRRLPVGAGRRKNKCSYSSIGNQQFSHITLSDELHHSLKHNRAVLSFGSDSVFITVEKTMDKCNRNRFHQPESGEEQPSGSLIAALKTKSEAISGNSNCTERFAVQIPNNSSGTTPWTFPWSPPIPFYPNMTHWGVPCLSPQLLSSSLSCPGKNSPALGKHSRDGNILKHGNSDKGASPKKENCLLMPKTLRIDDPEVAEKNSIWSSMGFKNDKGCNVTTKRGLFMDFQSKGELKHHPTVASLQILYANPAAHLRLVNFHEST